MRCSFIVPLQFSHSLIRYGESVLTERALITTPDRSSDPLRVRAPVHVCVWMCYVLRYTREIEKYLPTYLQLVDKVDQTSSTENANR